LIEIVVELKLTCVKWVCEKQLFDFVIYK